MVLRRLARGAREALRRPANETQRATPDQLRQRIADFGTWMYRFDLGNGVVTPLHDEYLDRVHRTRSSMIFEHLDKIFAGRWQQITCLDAACNEGYFAFEVAKRGAPKVVGFDARPINIEKAEFVRQQLAIPNASFQIDNVFAVTPERYGTFDLTLCLGLLYHLEDPVGALRRLRALTKELCVIDTEVLRAGAQVTIDRGPNEGVVETEDAFAVLAEPGWEWNPLSSVTGISLVPSMAALMTILKHTGFREVTRIQPPAGAVDRYANSDRVILLARV